MIRISAIVSFIIIGFSLTISGCIWDESNVAGADGHSIKLVDNPGARNPSWKELKNFLRQDLTDRIEYDEDTFACADYAERLHNSAEEAGWRAALVIVDLGPEFRTEPDQVISVYRVPRQTTDIKESLSKPYQIRRLHALNAFVNTDLGLVYIDSTGLLKGEKGPANMDAKVDIKIGSDYIPEYIFPEPGWVPVGGSLGKLEKIEVRW